MNMTIQLSLPEDLEMLVKQQVESGMYDSESDVVNQALRLYFHRLTEGEVLDTIMLSRIEALENGTLETTPWDSSEMKRWRNAEAERIDSGHNHP